MVWLPRIMQIKRPKLSKLIVITKLDGRKWRFESSLFVLNVDVMKSHDGFLIHIIVKNFPTLTQTFFIFLDYFRKSKRWRPSTTTEPLFPWTRQSTMENIWGCWFCLNESSNVETTEPVRRKNTLIFITENSNYRLICS